MTQKNKFSTNIEQRQGLTIRQKYKWLMSLMGTGLLLAALAFLKIYSNDYQNEGTVAVSINQTMSFGTDFVNGNSGYLSNEGELYFQKSLSNTGTIVCGTCSSGVNYFVNPDAQLQVLGGLQPIEMYDVVLNNFGNLQLETELQIINSFQFQDGFLMVEAGNPNAWIHFKENASYSGASDGGHILGYVGKTGDVAFTFPVGDGTYLKPIEITGASPTDFFKVGYFSTNPGATTFPDGSAYETNAKSGNIHTVYNKGFWDIDGTSATELKLEWNINDDFNGLLNDLSDLVVVGWDGSEWVSVGQNDLSGSISSGSIKTNPIIPDTYVAFTFARATAGTFPVEWLSFSAEKSPEGAHLAWSTAQELSSDSYEIERSNQSTEGFGKIGEMKAAGTTSEVSSYSYIDTEMLELPARSYFYRLKQIDMDGKYAYSKVVELAISQPISQLVWNMYPNPARAHIILDIKGNSTQKISLEILNMEGKSWLKQELAPQTQTQLSLESLSTGIYIARVSDETYTYTQKFHKR